MNKDNIFKWNDCIGNMVYIFVFYIDKRELMVLYIEICNENVKIVRNIEKR